ncbi:MAG: hypothetical protein PF501_13000 [Salinisphaera sp.]|nr:hypothetical protein [Salinisphaera sp.]
MRTDPWPASINLAFEFDITSSGFLGNDDFEAHLFSLSVSSVWVTDLHQQNEYRCLCTGAFMVVFKAVVLVGLRFDGNRFMS